MWKARGSDNTFGMEHQHHSGMMNQAGFIDDLMRLLRIRYLRLYNLASISNNYVDLHDDHIAISMSAGDT